MWTSLQGAAEDCRYRRVCAYMRVGHGVVPPEEPGGGDVSHQHVDGVVLVSDEDADDSGGAEQPAEPAVPPHPAGGVCAQSRTRPSANATATNEEV